MPALKVFAATKIFKDSGKATKPKKSSPPKKSGTTIRKTPSKPSSPGGSTQSGRNRSATPTKGWGLPGAKDDIDLSPWYGASRKLYLPGGLLEPSEVPGYLTGELPGDYGYDPLSLGQDKDQVAKYREAELIHARWAMLAAAGMIIPEGLAANGADIKGATWFETGASMLNGGTLDYFAVPFAVIDNKLPLIAVVVVEVGLMAAVEGYRSSGEGPEGYAPGVGKFDSSIFSGLSSPYPGGPFDPLNLASDPEVFAELKVKEIKNGRLAMISVLGFAVQAAVTGEGPYANWSKHVADPFGYNILTVLGSEDRVPSL